ncbi:S8 family serine peptidase [Paractinoplanes atraurantiacus]|uniref:Subtilase family protein n=1 Tax=Paractinoplanes atraurantiacus TaxID=1036182 RepID=A0A285KEV7_9ACTN|nr:S8 family serine peptidase [Actinoplanes atraurantiacus]SNY69811.1 Subtilase family protein [Actinoplanes atraurantiacus]
MIAEAESDAYRRVAPETAWPLSRGAGVLVGIVDSGVSAAATGLAGAVAPGRDVVAGGRADTDCLGRGTALAAVIAARPQPANLLSGVAPAARILPVRVNAAKGGIPPGKLAAGIRAAVDAGSRVVLVAVGAAPDPALAAAVAHAEARDVLVVAAVGNEKPGADGTPGPPWYPAAYPLVLAVGGVDAKGQATELVTGRAGLDLVAPGKDVHTVGTTGPGNYVIGGAPAAAAYVAGAAALVRSYRPGLKAAQVRRWLVDTAAPAGSAGRRLDVYAAVSAVAPAAPRTRGAAGVKPFALPAEKGHDPASRIAIGVVGLAVMLTIGLMFVVAVVRRRGHDAADAGSR